MKNKLKTENNKLKKEIIMDIFFKFAIDKKRSMLFRHGHSNNQIPNTEYH